MPRKVVSPAMARMRDDIWKRMRPYLPYFLGDDVEKKAKGRYLEALTLKHFHSFAIKETRGVNEWIFRKWLRDDDAFMEACNIVRLAFVDSLEYRALCRCGIYGEDLKKKYYGVDVPALTSFIRIARQHGVYRRLKGTGGPGQAPATGAVSRDGEGLSCVQIEDGREDDLCSLQATAPVPQKP